MKFVPVLSFLSVGLMVVIITQAVWQELNLHSLKDNTEKSSARIKSKEEAIIKVKTKNPISNCVHSNDCFSSYLAVSISFSAAEQDEAKQKAQAEIQQLKQQILNRDRAICTFVDLTNEEGRRLCANA
uniref:Uncharacterized protein n=1 Tax=Myripristis murdjan TaxID=586833 RepID=A0A667YPU4_9TELE